jgi:ABC toxin N-terminal region/Neuraminidase-like domain/Putative peptidoglycan binding domain
VTLKDIYAKAQQTSATAHALVAEYALGSSKVPTAAASDDVVLAVDGMPEWASLFGTLELCSCDHCRSVLSPAAYLVDTLYFLSARPSRVFGANAKDVLFLRRPDLGEIELTCENTNISLPYVDLALEALEDTVAPPPAFVPFPLPAAVQADLDDRTVSGWLKGQFTPPLSDDATITLWGDGQAWEVWWSIDDQPCTYAIRSENGQLVVVGRSRQTKGSAADRGATPQYRNAGAYNVLGKAVYPWSLPFGLDADEIATYLGHLGVPRARLMEAVLPGTREEVLTNDVLVRETLGLSPAEASIVVGVTTGQADSATPGIWNLWGFSDEFLNPDNAIPDPSDSARRIASGHWLAVLMRVDVFLQQSGLSYPELLDLLDGYYVNPLVNEARSIHIVSTSDNDQETCETSKLALDGLDAGTVARIVRFVRLWRRCGWTMRDLDRAITAFAPADLDDGFLTQLSHVQRLRVALDVPVLELLSWWAQIDAGVYLDHKAQGQPRAVSFYDQLFRDRTVLNPPDLAFVERPGQLTGTLSKHRATIAAALRISAGDFNTLLADQRVVPRDPADPLSPDDRLTMDHLSRLHRHTSLARALGLSVGDYLTALELIAPDPFDTTEGTVLFVEIIGRIRNSGFTAAELAYLLRNIESPQRPYSPDESAVTDLLAALRADLQQIALDTTFRADPEDPVGLTIDPNGDVTRQKLALLNWDATRIDQAVATLTGVVVYETLLSAVPPGLNLPNAPLVYAVPLAALPIGFALPAELTDAVAFDEMKHQLASSRVLTGPERSLLTDSATGTGDADLITAVGVLLAEQDALTGEIRHDPDHGVLRFSGPMTKLRKARLDSTPGGTLEFHAAVQQLYDAPRQFIRRQMRSFSVIDQFVELSALSTLIKFPPKLKGKVYFDNAKEPHELHFLGPMTEAERDELIALATDPADPNQAAYLAALQLLYEQVESLALPPGDLFLTADGVDNDAAALFDAPLEPGERFKHVLKVLMPYLRQALSERTTVQSVADALGLESRTADALLREWLRSPTNAARHPLDDLLDPAFAESSPSVAPTATAFPGQHQAYLRVHKTAFLSERLQLSFRQLGWLFTLGSAAGWLDPNMLPLDESAPAASFHEWLRVADFARLREWLAVNDALEELLELAQGVSPVAPAPEKNNAKEAWFADLLKQTGWSADDVQALIGAADDHAQTGQLDVSFPEAYTGEQLLLRLREAMALLRRMGITAADGMELAAADVSSAQARRLRQAVRAKYDEAQWQVLARPFSDTLRERQRAALVAYLVAHLRLPITTLEWPHPPLAFQANQPIDRPAVRELQRKLNAAGAAPADASALLVDGVFGVETRAAVIAFQQGVGLPGTGAVDDATWVALDQVKHGIGNSNDLYAHLLIDVEMDPCMTTSRIKQALGSVQLFAQRCLMGLEADVAAGIDVDMHWRQWKWMKNYRVWEANRRIFLYPENWVEPELRDDKSPFFCELEGDLLQTDPTDDTVETAFLRYLEKLDQVAHLEIVGMHHQLEQDNSGNLAVDVLHVFGRTPSGTPRVYFYRQRVHDVWTAWERIDVDIVTEHLIPIIWNRRLYLFWPIFTEKAEPADVAVTVSGGNMHAAAPAKYWEIQLAWSERKQGAWSGKKISSGTPIKRYESDHSQTDAFFRASITKDNVLDIVLFDRTWFDSNPGNFLNTSGFVIESGNADPQTGLLQVTPPAMVKGTIFDRMYQAEDDETPLYLPTPIDTAALAITPGRFRLLPHANGVSITKHPTFYQDNSRVYFVTPFDKVVWDLATPDTADPSVIFVDPGALFEYPQIDPGGPVMSSSDPAPFEASHAVVEA